MWIALSIIGGLVGLVVVMALVGLALPRDHVASRKTTLAKSPDEVWRVLVDLEGQTKWRRGLKRVELLSPTEFREHTTQGKLTFEVTESRERELRITRISDEKLPFGGRWIYELVPDGNGTRLTITEDGFVKNPVFRFLSKTVFSQAATIEKFLADLGAHLAVSVRVEPADPSPLVAPSSPTS